ncbi:MAG: glutamate--tRNA ligase [bacterium]
MGELINKSVRVRFAPSPTGRLHIGGARTALYNWLFARQSGGRFILRIEDTDIIRSTEDFTQSVIKDLKWLGLDWDEGPEIGGHYGPYFQSQRIEIYKRYVSALLEKRKAYFCYCTFEELEQRKKKMKEKGMLPKYDGRCRNLTLSERKEFEREGRSPTIRFRVTGEDTIYVDDLLRGKVGFETKMLGDFIILKSNGTPTFNFANVVDDALMKITHVIRGDDHLSNTPRQILLYEALSFKIPQYAHIPMILGGDGTKLSKRHGATSIADYREKGYLPWTMINYLVLLGWSTPESQQFFSREELIRSFSLGRVGKSAAIFDPRKLEWMNGEYIRKFKPNQLLDLLIPYLKRKNWVKKRIDPFTRKKILKVTELEQERIKVLSEITSLADFFFKSDFEYDQVLVDKRLKRDYVAPLLKKMKERIAGLPLFNEKNLERLIRDLASEFSLSPGEAFHPLRVALTGKMRGPGLFELAVVLGKNEVLRRIDRTVEMLKKRWSGASVP